MGYKRSTKLDCHNFIKWSFNLGPQEAEDLQCVLSGKDAEYLPIVDELMGDANVIQDMMKYGPDNIDDDLRTDCQLEDNNCLSYNALYTWEDVTWQFSVLISLSTLQIIRRTVQIYKADTDPEIHDLDKEEVDDRH
jgi:hypothetical protein